MICKIEMRLTGMKEPVMRTVRFFKDAGMVSDVNIKVRPSGLIQAYGTMSVIEASDESSPVKVQYGDA